MTEEQWTALKAWIEREASDRAGGLLSRLGHITQQEQAARVAFGLTATPPGYAPQTPSHWAQSGGYA